ncbi:hypothetical protein B296_00013931 [Ensete ventricosum]|uniref:Uncharacterized protein n=1 Tax=Ensete ventricosum TaxID=4639 RepID=A0A426ZFN3_ENSVE|nr:hypothetical protein B296_00013931 [Ensete ventricosum]
MSRVNLINLLSLSSVVASPDFDAPSLPTVSLTAVFPIFPTQAASYPCPRYSSSHPFLSQQPHIATALSLDHLFLHRPPIFLSSLPPQPAISAISLPSLATRTKSRHRSPAAPAFCSQPLPPIVAPAALVSSSKKITVIAIVAALADHGRCLLPSLLVASSPRPPATSSYASSPRPTATAKPSSDAPTLPPASPFLPPQSQPKPSPTLPPSSSSAFSSLSTTTPLCSDYTLLYRCSRRNLLLGRALLYHRGTLVPSSFPIVVITPKHRRCPSSIPPLRCLLLSALLTTPLPPPLSLLPLLPQPLSTTPLLLHLLAATSLPLLHLAATRYPSLLSASPTRRNTATTSLIAAISACCHSRFKSCQLPLQQLLPLPYNANSCP